MHAIVAVTHSINWPCNIEDSKSDKRLKQIQ